MSTERLISIFLGMAVGILIAFSVGIAILVITALTIGGISDENYLLMFLLYPICMTFGGIVGAFTEL